MLLLIPFGAAGLVSPDQAGQRLAALFPGSAIVLSALAARAGLRETSPPMRWAKLLVLLAADIACVVAVVVALNATDALRRGPIGRCRARHLADRALLAR